jgi:hypothetical protein
MIKHKVEIEYSNGRIHYEVMSVEEYTKFKNHNIDNENINDIRMIFE